MPGGREDKKSRTLYHTYDKDVFPLVPLKGTINHLIFFEN